LLKRRARRNGRSLQKEVKLMLEQMAGTDPDATKKMFADWKQKFAGRQFKSSVELLRADRDH
jgi:hypothetical protein